LKACASEDASRCFAKLSFFFHGTVHEYQQNFVILLELFSNPTSQDGRIFAVKPMFTVFIGFSLDEK